MENKQMLQISVWYETRSHEIMVIFQHILELDTKSVR